MRYQPGDAVYVITKDGFDLVYPATVVSGRTGWRYVVQVRPPGRARFLTHRTANGLWFRKRVESATR